MYFERYFLLISTNGYKHDQLVCLTALDNQRDVEHNGIRFLVLPQHNTTSIKYLSTLQWKDKEISAIAGKRKTKDKRKCQFEYDKLVFIHIEIWEVYWAQKKYELTRGKGILRLQKNVWLIYPVTKDSIFYWSTSILYANIC